MVWVLRRLGGLDQSKASFQRRCRFTQMLDGAKYVHPPDDNVNGFDQFHVLIPRPRWFPRVIDLPLRPAPDMDQLASDVAIQGGSSDRAFVTARIGPRRQPFKTSPERTVLARDCKECEVRCAL